MGTKKKKKFSTFRILLIVGVLLAVIYIVFSLFGKVEATEVVSEKVGKRTLLSSVTESGVVEPRLEVKVNSDVSGKMVELKVAEGERVTEGQHLLTIQPDNYESQLEQAQAGLNAAKANQLQAKASHEQAKATLLLDSANFVRSQQLFRNKAISQTELESSELKYQVSRSQLEATRQSARAAGYQVANSQASLKQARQNLQRTTILATMEGTVTRLNLEVGESVLGTIQTQGTEILKIADLSQMEISSEINENDIVHIRIGDSANIEIDAFEGKIFKGTVTEIAYSASQEDMLSTDQVTNFEVKVGINPSSYLNDKEMMSGLEKHQSPFRPGLSAQIEIFTDKKENTLAVPIQSVTVDRSSGEEEPAEIVYLLEGNQVRPIEVVTGISDGKYIEIKEGLSGGEEIVTGPYIILTRTLKEGMKVRRKRNKEKSPAK